ncbi:MAG: TolC family protein [Myxococcota bacterium]
MRKLSMRLWYALAISVALGLFSASPSAGAEEPTPDPVLHIGSVSDVDTQTMRRLIEESTQSSVTQIPALPPLVLDLEQAVRTALESNLQLQIAALDRNVAEALVPAARAKFHPTPGLDVIAAEERLVDAPDDPDSPGELEPGTLKEDEQAVLPFVRQELPTGGTLLLVTDLNRQGVHDGRDIADDDPEPDRDDYAGGSTLLLRQPLLRGGRVYVARREILDAEYNLDILEAQLRAQILQVTAQVKEAYYNTLLAQRLIEVSEQALVRDRSLLEASRALFEAGRATRRDVLSAEIRISDDEASLARNRAALEGAQLVLRDVLGTPIGQPIRAAEATVPFEPVPIRLASWIASALENRPELRQLLTRLDQSSLAVQVASNDVLPMLDFLGSYRRVGFDSSWRKTWDLNSQVWAAGLHFEIPLGNVAARERLRAAKFLHERVERELEAQRRLIEIEVRTEEISLRENLGNLAAQTAKVEQARDKLETANTRFRLGLADNFDVTDAQEDLVSAESEFLVAIVDYVNSLARLEARIAGPL